jgi:ATP-dependent Clp protease ATP-binding subunit ClpC
MTDCGRIRDKAIEEAERLGHTGIGCEHLLLGVLADEQGMARTVLGSHGVTLGAARDSVDQMVGSGWRGNVRWTLSPRATVVERLAEVEAERGRLGRRKCLDGTRGEPSPA